MKKLFFYLLLFAIPLLTQCNDDEQAVETLPEATQTGRGIFACLVDGKPFIDKSGSPNAISFNTYYQLIDGEYYFFIGGNDEDILPQYIYLQADKKVIQSGYTYPLLELIDGNTYGGGGCILNC